MSDELVNGQAAQQAGEGHAFSLPDINAENPYRFDTIQHLLDEASYFNLFSTPDHQRSNVTIVNANHSDDIIGFRTYGILHRFAISMWPPTLEAGLRTTNVMGEMLGRFDHRWMIIPDDFGALPGREPPPTLLNPSRSQRFVMLDGICSFNGGADGFHGFGTGTTYPVVVNGQSQLHAAAVGSLTEGFGKFEGREGTYTYCGRLSQHEGFSGSLLCRILDPGGELSTENSLPSLQPWPDPDPGTIYLIMRGQKRDKSQKTTYNFAPDGQVVGINVAQQLRLVQFDSANRERGGLRSIRTVGPEIGKMTARILFNFFNPAAPGTVLAPIPFQSYNEYTFLDREGRSIGSIAADGREGRTFRMKLPGAPKQVALRFGGFGLIVNGTGQFEGIKGLMIDNSVVAVAPSAISTLYVLRIHDPEGKYRGALREVTDSCQRDREKLIDACRR
jgi:hypothetical protein